MKATQTRLIVSTLACAPLFLAACGQSIEKNTLFKDQQKIVARLDDDSKRIGMQVEDIQVSVNALKSDMREVKNSPKGTLVGDKTLEQRLKAIETQLAEIQSSANENTTRVAKLELGGRKAAAHAKEAETFDGASEPAAEAKPVSSSSKSKTGKVTRTSEEKPSKPRGAYYKVREGDTAEAIAAAHAISVNSLYAENRIPSGGKIFPGQQIYVPAANTK